MSTCGRVVNPPAKRAFLPLKQREFIANRAGRKPGGGAEAPALRGRFQKYHPVTDLDSMGQMVKGKLEFPLTILC